MFFFWGNSGSRLDCTECIPALLPLGISVCAFDFRGSGLSSGKFISLGHFEKYDIAAVVKHLKQK